MIATVTSLVTCLLALVLGADFLRQYGQRHRTHAFWWFIAFLVTCVAALMQLLAFASGGFVASTFRLYVITSAAVPALMGAGTMYLLWRRIALPYVLVALAFIAVTAVGAFMGTVHPVLLHDVLRASQEVTRTLPSPYVITGYAVLGTIGAGAIVLGALWSWLKTRRAYNFGLMLGGIVFSLADTMAAYGVVALFFLAQIVGMVAIFLAVRASQHPSSSSAGQVKDQAG